MTTLQMTPTNYQLELTCPKCGKRAPYLYPQNDGSYICSVCRDETADETIWIRSIAAGRKSTQS